MATIAKPFEGLYDLMIRDQVFRIISQYLRLSLKKKTAFHMILRKWNISQTSSDIPGTSSAVHTVGKEG